MSVEVVESKSGWCSSWIEKQRQRSLAHSAQAQSSPSVEPVLVQRIICELLAVNNHSRLPRFLNNLQLVSDTKCVMFPLPAFLLRVQGVLPRLVSGSGSSFSPVSTLHRLCHDPNGHTWTQTTVYGDQG